MPGLDPPFRPAVEADGPALAVLMNEASHGLSLHAWTRMAEPGGDPWSIGAALQAERARDGLWTVVDEGAGVIAGLQVWPSGGGAPAHALRAVFEPMVALRALAADALYVNVVATLPDARGRGLGTRLMRVAEDIARAQGQRRLCLVVADDNDAARRLYRRLGYRERANRPMVKDAWEGPGAEWLLMITELDAQVGPAGR
jgi:ribosomal protein S18 acetylase RimI-like enzyme